MSQPNASDLESVRSLTGMGAGARTPSISSNDDRHKRQSVASIPAQDPSSFTSVLVRYRTTWNSRDSRFWEWPLHKGPGAGMTSGYEIGCLNDATSITTTTPAVPITPKAWLL